MTNYDSWKVSGSCAGNDEDQAWERFQSMFNEDEGEPKDEMMGRYLEEHPEDEKAAGYDRWLDGEFAGWYEGQVEDAASEKADRS